MVNLHFDKLLSHTFPGLFMTITIFMIFDLIFNLNLFQWVFSEGVTLTGFIGLLILLGTIIGTFLDMLHQYLFDLQKKEKLMKWILVRKDDRKSIIERREIIIKKSELLINYIDDKKKLKKQKILDNCDTKFPYFTPFINIENYKYLLSEFYYYSEFLANISFTIIPFFITIVIYSQKYSLLPYSTLFFIAFLVLIIVIGFIFTRICLILAIKTDQEFWYSCILFALGEVDKLKMNQSKFKEENNDKKKK